MRSDLALPSMQWWMQNVITDPVEDASGADERILPSAKLTATERVLIYRGMYLLRMVEALQVDYPALARFLGDERFHDLVAAYVEHYPSRSYTLNRLGDDLPRFIRGSKLRQKTFLYDLARLELAMSEVFDEEESEPMPAGAIDAVPAEEAGPLRFEPIPALRLLAFDYDANGAFQAYRDEEPIHRRRGKSWLAVYRRDYSIYRMPLSREAHAFLTTLCGGSTVGEAIDAFAEAFDRAPSRDEVFIWFRDWTAAGLFHATET